MAKKAVLAVELADIGEIHRLLASGADEIIVPVEGLCFGIAPTGAINEVARIVRLAHEAGMKCSAACGKLFAQYELAGLCQRLLELQQAGVDAIIFQDPAFIGMCDVPLVFDGMTMPVNALDAAWWLRHGCANVVLAPLLEREEILSTLSKTSCSMQVFGRPILSVSRRKLDSAFEKEASLATLAGKRSLRLVEEKRAGQMPVFEGSDHCVVYADFVLDMFQDVARFVEAGLNRLVIGSAFLESSEVLDAVGAFARILEGNDGGKEREEYAKRHPLVPLERGWLDEKTVR